VVPKLSSSVAGIACLPQLCCQAKALGRTRQSRHQVPYPCYVLSHKVPSPLRSFFSLPLDINVLKEALVAALYMPEQYKPQLKFDFVNSRPSVLEGLGNISISLPGHTSWAGAQES